MPHIRSSPRVGHIRASRRVRYIHPSPLVGPSLLGLAFAGGALDATSYLGLGRIFTANMTGNTVLLVTALAGGGVTHALRAGAALAGFSVGAFAGALVVAPGRRAWPAKARVALQFELVGLTALLVGWAAWGVEPIRYELIATGGLVMGMQAAISMAARVHNVNTTFITGTLTTAISRLARRASTDFESSEGVGLPWSTWITYGAGALAGAFAVGSWHYGAVSLPLAMVAATCAGAWLQREPGA